VQIECSAPAVDIPVDPMRVRQALDNLLDNAIRYGPETGGLIRVDATVSSEMATVRIENTGPGFSGGVLPRAFQAFVRGDSDTAAPAGAGLGLAIVQAVARAHGGTAHAENVPSGARLTMTLALDPEPVPGAGRNRAPVPSG
jgi:signal transduction histidine kinase